MSVEANEEGFYIAGEFRGKTQYQCSYCAFDALELWRIRDHIINRHQMKVIEEQRTKVMSVTLYDSRGNMIVERELTDGEISINQDGA